jgi:hypothetical protein
MAASRLNVKKIGKKDQLGIVLEVENKSEGLQERLSRKPIHRPNIDLKSETLTDGENKKRRGRDPGKNARIEWKDSDVGESEIKELKRPGKSKITHG